MPSSTDQLEFYDLSHPWGHNAPLWPYFPDVKIERFHYHAKSRVLSQQITTFMHCTTHTDAPAHVVEGAPFMDEVPLDRFFGSCGGQKIDLEAFLKVKQPVDSHDVSHPTLDN